jgi:hypothetical protein
VAGRGVWNEDGAGRIGVLWLSLTHPRGAPDTAWIYDSVSALALNVFGDNETAPNLYSSSDYQITTQQMRKQLYRPTTPRSA